MPAWDRQRAARQGQMRLDEEAWSEFIDILNRSDNPQLAALRVHNPAWNVRRDTAR